MRNGMAKRHVGSGGVGGAAGVLRVGLVCVGGWLNAELSGAVLLLWAVDQLRPGREISVHHGVLQTLSDLPAVPSGRTAAAADEVWRSRMTARELEADDVLKLEFLRVSEALGLDRAERLLASIRRSLPGAPQAEIDVNWAGQTQATKVTREWINTHRVEYRRPERSLGEDGRHSPGLLAGAAMTRNDQWPRRVHACAVCDRACECARGWRYLEAHPKNYQRSQVSDLSWEFLVPAGECDCPHGPQLMEPR